LDLVNDLVVLNSLFRTERVERGIKHPLDDHLCFEERSIERKFLTSFRKRVCDEPRSESTSRCVSCGSDRVGNGDERVLARDLRTADAAAALECAGA